MNTNLLCFLALLLCTSVSAQILTVSEEIPMRNDTEYTLVGKLGLSLIHI